jgi:4-hydroxy-tetrahydrodipicolinate synthase
MTQFGISVALLTPFTADGALDLPKLAQHAQSVLSRGAHGVTLFGTTGEGASIGRAERLAGLKALLEAGVAPAQLTLGVVACALPDAAEQIAEAVALGVTQFLVLPPFYFKGCSDDGLYDWHMRLAQATPASARLILYHIPQVSGVPLSVGLVGRLARAAPDRFVAIKDSSGAWPNTEALLQAGDVQVLVGDERQLAAALRLGAAGSICGTANLVPERLVQLYTDKADDPVLADWVGQIVQHPVVPALKVLMARQTQDPGWAVARAPLEPLSPDAAETLSISPARNALATAAGVGQA